MKESKIKNRNYRAPYSAWNLKVRIMLSWEQTHGSAGYKKHRYSVHQHAGLWQRWRKKTIKIQRRKSDKELIWNSRKRCRSVVETLNSQSISVNLIYHTKAILTRKTMTVFIKEKQSRQTEISENSTEGWRCMKVNEGVSRLMKVIEGVWRRCMNL